jgi:hypothetical protein
MFFAEVRPFEEIFREDESQQGGQQGASPGGQQGEQTEQLLELQKQVITASWNLDRKRAGTPVADSFKEDVEVVRASQEQALEQAGALKERASTEQAARLISDAVDAMEKAVTQLAEAKEDPSALSQALAREQEAYQALLKLRQPVQGQSIGSRQPGQSQPGPAQPVGAAPIREPV